MKIQYDDKKHKKELYELWQAAFQDTTAFAEYYFQWVYPKNQVIVAADSEGICSMLHLNPYTWAWKQKAHNEETHKTTAYTKTLHYIVGVATKETHRRQGFMAACMKQALQDMEQAGEPFTYLMPAKKEYYEPFQFVMVKEACKLRYENGSWSKEGKETEGKEADYKLFPLRSPQYLEQLQEELQSQDGAILKWDTSDAYAAYVKEVRKEETVLIIEQLWLPETEKERPKEILEKTVIPLLYRQAGVYPVEYQVSQAVMLRILNLEQFVSLLPYEGVDITLQVYVRDTLCKGNEGGYSILLSTKENQIKRWQQEEERKPDCVEWDIGQLTDWLLQSSDFAGQMYMMEIV